MSNLLISCSKELHSKIFKELNFFFRKIDFSCVRLIIATSCIFDFCNEKASNFILIYRDTNVLKKCGQYQDLICLSEGYNHPYTYTDFSIYGSNRRMPDKMFTYLDNNDYQKIYNIHHQNQ